MIVVIVLVMWVVRALVLEKEQEKEIQFKKRGVKCW